MRASILFCIALAGSSAFGQAGRGTIAGTVLDPVGSAFSGATVQAKNVSTGTVVKATSGAAGKYTFADLPPGQYDVTVALPGVRPFEQKNVTVEGAKTASLNIR